MMKNLLIGLAAVAASVATAATEPNRTKKPGAAESTVNSIGMRLTEIPAGRFTMGEPPPKVSWKKYNEMLAGSQSFDPFEPLTNRYIEQGLFPDLDEQPAHEVIVSRPFRMSVTEVTNEQYEQFDPAHKRFREALNSHRPTSTEDDDAVTFVTWHDAVAFCEWLSKREGRPYRLPTEAEWEYACRAGTTTPFFTGDTLPHPEYGSNLTWVASPADALGRKMISDSSKATMRVGTTQPNAWGLHDMHGNAEEWCLDWYGPYAAGEHTDPVGYNAGDFRVTRSGFRCYPRYLRSANRLGTLPSDRQWQIGFRVVQAPLPATQPLPRPKNNKLWARGVGAKSADWTPPVDMRQPHFQGPLLVFNFSGDSWQGPFFRHNHVPGLTWCPNGDLLAAWFTVSDSEGGPQMTILASRLRRGAEAWDRPAEFFKAPDRNMSGTQLFTDDEGTLHHINAVSVGYGYTALSMVHRSSRDNGVTWSAPELMLPDKIHRAQCPMGNIFMTAAGDILTSCDTGGGWGGGCVLYRSRDRGETWEEMTDVDKDKANYVQAGKSAGRIGGSHANVVELRDGRLMALGRVDPIDRRMPMSISADGGRTWTYRASEFPVISTGQRPALLRLREGPIMFISYASNHNAAANKKMPWLADGMPVRDAAGKERRIFGAFVALSFDEGETWVIKKPFTNVRRPTDFAARSHDPGDDRAEWTLKGIDPTHGQPGGYFVATQTPDGLIHAVSSAWYYCFNLAWLKEPMPADE